MYEFQYRMCYKCDFLKSWNFLEKFVVIVVSYSNKPWKIALTKSIVFLDQNKLQ